MEGVCSSLRWVDEGRSAAANTVAVESCGDVNVNDVDAALLGGFHRCLDREIQGSRSLVDLGLEGQVRIVLGKLKQKRIASDHDERVGRRVCHLRVQICETAPEHLAPALSSGLILQSGLFGTVAGYGRTSC